jgi:hypothetical protein
MEIEEKLYDGERFRLDLFANLEITAKLEYEMVFYLAGLTAEDFQKDIKYLMEKCLKNKTY